MARSCIKHNEVGQGTELFRLVLKRVLKIHHDYDGNVGGMKDSVTENFLSLLFLYKRNVNNHNGSACPQEVTYASR